MGRKEIYIMGRYYPPPKPDLSGSMILISHSSLVVKFSYKGTEFREYLKNVYGLVFFTFKDNAYVIQSDKIEVIK